MNVSSSVRQAENTAALIPKAKKRQRKVKERIAFWILMAIIGYLVLPPLLMMIWTSFNPKAEGFTSAVSLSAYIDIFSTEELWEYIWNTIYFAVSSTFFGVIIGSVMAWIVARTDAPFKKLAYATTFIGFAVPGMLKVIGWILLFGENNGAVNNVLRALFGPDAGLSIQSMGGMIFVESLIWTPMVFLLMVGPLQSMDPSLEESAFVSGSPPWKTYAKITARLLLPSILSVLILMFIRSVQAFEVPLFLGAPNGVYVLTSHIYLDLHESFIRDYAQASAYGTVLISLLSMVLLVYYFVTQKANRFQTITGKGFRPRTIRLGRWRWAASAYLIAVFVVMIAPICYVIFSSFLKTLSGMTGSFWSNFTLDHYREMFSYAGVISSVWNSLKVALYAATITGILAACASWVLVRTKLKGRWVLDQLIGLPLVFPGIVLSLAVLIFYLYTPIPLYGTLWIIVVAYIAHFTPYAMRYTQPALLQIHADLEDSAKMSGAKWTTVFRKVLLPLLMPALLGAWIFIFFHSVRELSIASLLYTAQTSVVATQILDMWANGNLNVMAAFGSFITVISVITAVIVFTYARKFGIKV